MTCISNPEMIFPDVNNRSLGCQRNLKDAGQTAQDSCDGLQVCRQVEPGHTVCSGYYNAISQKGPGVYCAF